jgi:hypothetical protein
VHGSGDHGPSDLGCSDLEQFVLQCRRRGFAPNTVHGYAQLKTLCRLGHRLGYIPDDITTGFEMPRVPKRHRPPPSPTSSSMSCSRFQDRRTWVGIRDRAILLVLLDSLIRSRSWSDWTPRTSISTKE